MLSLMFNGLLYGTNTMTETVCIVVRTAKTINMPADLNERLPFGYLFVDDLKHVGKVPRDAVDRVVHYCSLYGFTVRL